MNQLALQFNFYEYEINGTVQPSPHRQADFVVDGSGLGAALNFEEHRPWLGQTCFDYLPDDAEDMIDELKGLRRVHYALHNNRFPLYRCHCGDISCGVVSCVIQRLNDVVRWIDIRFEEDDDDVPEFSEDAIPLLEFCTVDYDAVIDRFTVEAAK
jgi:hypothetical protein